MQYIQKVPDDAGRKRKKDPVPSTTTSGNTDTMAMLRAQRDRRLVPILEGALFYCTVLFRKKVVLPLKTKAKPRYSAPMGGSQNNTVNLIVRQN